MNPHSEQAEEIYKQGLIETISGPHLILMLYGRMLRLLKQVSAQSPLNQWRLHLQAAHQILTHLLGIFSQYQGPVYQQLYYNHEALAQELSQLFILEQPAPQALKPLITNLEEFQAAWQEQLNIKPRHSVESVILNVNRHQAYE